MSDYEQLDLFTETKKEQTESNDDFYQNFKIDNPDLIIRIESVKIW